MALRMNLYGWDLQTFLNVLGSRDAAIRDAACENLGNMLDDPELLENGRAWVRRLIDQGETLREQRLASETAKAGELPTSPVECEHHAFGLFAIAAAIKKETHLGLSEVSSSWKYDAVTALSEEFKKCDFRCGMPLLTALYHLSIGTPLFGDSFRTNWSFYAILKRGDLPAIVSALRASIDYERKLPDNMPDHLRQNVSTKLSDSGKEFARQLSGWLEQIDQAGQDALVMWW